MECEVTEPSTVFVLTGHTHEWGERFSLIRTPAGTTTEETLYDVAVGEGFRDEPPLVSYPPDAPLQLEPGDRLRMRCDWFNTESEPLYYPKEMCAAPLFYYPSRGFEACFQDNGKFELLEID